MLQHDHLSGPWAGTKSLWLEPQQAAQTSPSSAEITLPARGNFVSIRYTWIAPDGSPQAGLLLFSPTQPDAIWIDSWHMQDVMMRLERDAPPPRRAWTGAYAAPPGPD